MQFTEEQQQVIDSRGENLLVSAAAGSGKTAVLVERILQRILDEKEPVDIDRMLIVTFTNAAAAEMRERIRSGNQCGTGGTSRQCPPAAPVHVGTQRTDYDH